MIIYNKLLIIILLILLFKKCEDGYKFKDGSYPKNKILKFNMRRDRYGSMGIHIANLILSSMYLNNTLLYDDITNRRKHTGTVYTDSVLDDIILDTPNIRRYNKRNKYNINIGDKDMLAVNLYKEDIPTILKRTGLNKRWYQHFDNKAKHKGWKLPSQSPYIAIHVRLEDAFYQNRDVARRTPVEMLSRIISMMKNKYPYHKIFLITTNNSKDLTHLKEVLKDMNQTVDGIVANEDTEHDLWVLMSSDILVTSFSAFSLYAGCLHQGSKVYVIVPYTDMTTKRLGVTSKYNKSDWEPIEE